MSGLLASTLASIAPADRGAAAEAARILDAKAKPGLAGLSIAKLGAHD